MADIALTYVGQPGVNACLAAGQGSAYPGQCKQFVNCIIVLSGGPMPGGGDDYAGSFIRAGGTEISEGEATKGDIIQWGSGSTTSQHTAIVVSNLGAGRFDVVDSNWGSPGLTVKHHLITNIHADIFNGAGAQPTRFIRMGTATNPDRDGDGTPNASDRCPDLPGPANTGGCPDTDADGTADLDDQCPTMPGLPALRGCSEEDVNPRYGPSVDFDGDGKTDYCRRVGAAYPQSRVSCTLSTGTGFGQTIQSPVLDWGYDTGRMWVGRSRAVPGGAAGPRPRTEAPQPNRKSEDRIRLEIRAPKNQRLAIAVQPKQTTIRVQVQRKSRSGRWEVVERLQLRPPKGSKVVDLHAGKYRVVAPRQKGLVGDTSRTVRIKR